MLKNRNRKLNRTVLAVVTAGAITVAGCATWPNQVEDQVTKASSALEAAKIAGASRFAPDIVKSSENYLGQAQQLLQEGKLEEATRSALKASADAQLAFEQAEAGGKNDKIETLRQEIASLLR